MKKRFLNTVIISSLLLFFACNNAGKKNIAGIADSNIDEQEVVKEEAADSVIVEAENKEAETLVQISTSFGDITLVLYNTTPKHRDNFLKLIKEGVLDGTIFHRVINEFMIQGGDPMSKNPMAGETYGTGGPGYTIPAEFISANYHKKGALAAARQPDNMNPRKASSGSQFYIVTGRVYTRLELNNIAIQMGISFTDEQISTYTTVGGTPFLDQNYTVFGEVVDGLDVVDAIGKTRTVKPNANDRPVQDIKMTIKIVE